MHPQSIYNQVMKNAIAKGVIFVKAAGNSGTEGPFRADVATAVGSITVASVDADAAPRISKFSSYGPVSVAGGDSSGVGGSPCSGGLDGGGSVGCELVVEGVFGQPMVLLRCIGTHPITSIDRLLGHAAAVRPAGSHPGPAAPHCCPWWRRPCAHNGRQ